MSGGSSTRYRTQRYPRVRTNLLPIITPATTTIPSTTLVIIPIHSFEIGVVVCGVDVTDCVVGVSDDIVVVLTAARVGDGVREDIAGVVETSVGVVCTLRVDVTDCDRVTDRVV